MKATMTKKPTAAASVIRYRTDLTRPESGSIVLGIVIEVTTPHVKAVGLLARASLPARDLARLDQIAKVQLANPADYLQRECMRGLATSPGNVLKHLAQEHAWAFYVSEPTVRELPLQIGRLKKMKAVVRHVEAWLSREIGRASKEHGGDVAPRASAARRVSGAVGRKPARARRTGYVQSYTVQTREPMHA